MLIYRCAVKQLSLSKSALKEYAFVSLDDYYFHQKVNKLLAVHDYLHCLDKYNQLTGAVTLGRSYGTVYFLLKM